jgi:DNA adenine methylase
MMAMMPVMPPTRPVLRYHGGKWILAPWIIEHFPKHRIYVEPYGGAASVLLRKPRAYAEVYNDLDGEVVNLFRVLRDEGQAERLVRSLRLTPFAREEFEATYGQPPADPVERARQLIARSFMGFGSAAATKQISGFRANCKRAGTTPAHDWANYPDALQLIVERLRAVVIEHRPAVQVIRTHDSKATLFYVDPPYVFDTRHRGGRRHTYQHEMTDAQHRELAQVLHGVNGMVVLSGYECPLYDELYGEWRKVTRSTYADGAKARVEALWLSPRVKGVQMNLF